MLVSKRCPPAVPPPPRETSSAARHWARRALRRGRPVRNPHAAAQTRIGACARGREEARKARSGNLGHLRNTRRRQAEQHCRSQHLQQQPNTSRAHPANATKSRTRGRAHLNDDVLATSILAFRHRLYTRAELLRQARRNRRPRVDVEAVAFVRHSHECPGLESGAQREMGDVGAIGAVGCC